jgi:hypothetical protein
MLAEEFILFQRLVFSNIDAEPPPDSSLRLEPGAHLPGYF